MFLIVVLSIWGLANFLVLYRTNALLSLPTSARIALLCVAIVLALSYALGRILGHRPGSLMQVGQILEGLGARWVALFVFVFLVFASLELIHWMSWALKGLGVLKTSLWTGVGLWSPGWRWALAVGLWGLAAVPVLLGHQELNGPFRVGRVFMDVCRADNRDPTPGIRLVQLSDMHLGAIASERHWTRTLEMTAELQPDVLLLTGDFMEDQTPRARRMLGHIGQRLPGVPVYAVMGNHEMYAGEASSLDAAAQAGIRVLRQEALPLNNGLWLAGIDDPHFEDPVRAVSQIRSIVPEDAALILMSHRPASALLVQDRSDTLVLSGHVHGGQFWPFRRLAARSNAGFLSGLYDVGQARLYLSNGSGYWGPPIRLGAPPEIVVVDVSWQQ